MTERRMCAIFTIMRTSAMSPAVLIDRPALKIWLIWRFLVNFCFRIGNMILCTRSSFAKVRQIVAHGFEKFEHFKLHIEVRGIVREILLIGDIRK